MVDRRTSSATSKLLTKILSLFCKVQGLNQLATCRYSVNSRSVTFWSSNRAGKRVLGKVSPNSNLAGLKVPGLCLLIPATLLSTNALQPHEDNFCPHFLAAFIRTSARLTRMLHRDISYWTVFRRRGWADCMSVPQPALWAESPGHTAAVPV